MPARHRVHPDTRRDGTYEHDGNYLDTRVTADGRDGYPVEPGRYRLIAARACPWANRAIIVRRLLGLEVDLSVTAHHLHLSAEVGR